MSYIKANFLLKSDTAVELYEQFAKNEPIFDYHCHLSEYQIYEMATSQDRSPRRARCRDRARRLPFLSPLKKKFTR